MSAEEELRELLGPVKVARVRAGDVIVYETDDPLTTADASNVADRLKRVFPDNRVIVTDSRGKVKIMRLGGEDKDPRSQLNDGEPER